MKHEYTKLKIWIKARALNKEIYGISQGFPKFEHYGLRDQLRRAAVSVVSNIAEGSGYDSDSQFVRYLNMSMGSLCELETHCYVSFDLNYLSKGQLDYFINQSDELKRMFLKFISKLKSNIHNDHNL